MADTPRLIVYAKWRNPYSIKDGPEYIPEKDVVDYDNDMDKVYTDEEDYDLEMEEQGTNPVIVTPVGIIPLRQFNDPSKVFNFWLGETNFTIGKDVAKIINEVPGVEILDVFTRYKFRIAIGNNFKFQEVRQAIEKELNAVTVR